MSGFVNADARIGSLHHRSSATVWEDPESLVQDDVPLDNEYTYSQFRLFKGRHIQMMALGNIQSLKVVLR
jgi:hypothetical protein